MTLGRLVSFFAGNAPSTEEVCVAPVVRIALAWARQSTMWFLQFIFGVGSFLIASSGAVRYKFASWEVWLSG